MKLDRDRAALVVVDVQEGFRKAIPGFGDIARATATLARGAAALEVPVIVTEQYPEGLGATVPEVTEALPGGTSPLPKVCFSAAEADGFGLGQADQVLVCGVEAHVCVNQTVLDLLGSGREVHVAEDAVGSRFADSKRIGLEKMTRAGAMRTNVETALFEMLGRAGTGEFKTIQKLILDFAPNPA